MFLKKIFDKYEEPTSDEIRSSPWLSLENYRFDDIEYVIFQMTQPYRSRFKFVYKGKDYFVHPNPDFDDVSIVFEKSSDGVENPVENGVDTVFFKWLDENNYTIQDYLDLHMTHFNNTIKDYLQHLESKGSKTKVLFWVNESSSMFEDDFYKERHILLEHEGKTYKTISDLQLSCKERFVIAYDKEGFGGEIPENAKSEIDFLIQKENQIIPIEVKSAENVKSRSLRVYFDKFHPQLSIRTSLSGFKKQEWMENIPMYCFHRWVKQKMD